MVTEWRLNGDVKGGFQSHFSYHSVIIQSAECQAHFSNLSVSLVPEKQNYAQPGSNRGCKNQRESTLTIRPRDPYSF